eukprot:scaffold7695_cov64-Phaeocystis_antarctica.AAC.6
MPPQLRLRAVAEAVAVAGQRVRQVVHCPLLANSEHSLNGFQAVGIGRRDGEANGITQALQGPPSSPPRVVLAVLCAGYLGSGIKPHRGAAANSAATDKVT